MEIDELIQQGRALKNALQCHYGDLFTYYTHADNQEYEIWLAYTRRYLKTEYEDDEFVADFEKAAAQINPSPEQMDKMIACLEAISRLPQVVKKVTLLPNPAVTINNTQTQSQSQSMYLKVVVDALHEELNLKQIRELKDIVENKEIGAEEKKLSIFEKIKGFGMNTLASMFANILTNPKIWEMM